MRRAICALARVTGSAVPFGGNFKTDCISESGCRSKERTRDVVPLRIRCIQLVIELDAELELPNKKGRGCSLGLRSTYTVGPTLICPPDRKSIALIY